MQVELIISKDRIPYIIEELGKDKVAVSDYNEDSDRIQFEMTSVLDILFVFHAGIKCGQKSMSDAFLRKTA